MASISSKKIRVALIGLNAPHTGRPTGSGWAVTAHLPYLRQSSKYEIVALQNSSTERAKQAIEAHRLDPEKVRAYGTPEEVANDPDVDLVVSSIRVDRHGGSVIPSIKAGKSVFVEWPLEATLPLARYLSSLVKQHNARNIVGLQGQFAPIVKTLRWIIGHGDIGTIESSTLIAKNRSGSTIPVMIDYFTDRAIGGNPFTIGFGHLMELAVGVLGDVHQGTARSVLVNQYPEVTVVEPGPNTPLETKKNDVPNQILFNAVLGAGTGAVFTVKIHNSATPSPGVKPPPPQTAGKRALPALEWRIFGTKGEIRVTSYDTWALNIGGEDTVVEVWNVDEGNVVREVEVKDDLEGVLPLKARNIARLYEAFAAGTDGEKKREWYPDFEYAVKRHEVIEEMYRENGYEAL